MTLPNDVRGLRGVIAVVLDEDVPRCATLGEPIPVEGSLSPAQLAAVTEEALRGCGGAVDIDRDLTLLRLLIAPTEITVASRPIALDPEGRGVISAHDPQRQPRTIWSDPRGDEHRSKHGGLPPLKKSPTELSS